MTIFIRVWINNLRLEAFNDAQNYDSGFSSSRILEKEVMYNRELRRFSILSVSCDILTNIFCQRPVPESEFELTSPG